MEDNLRELVRWFPSGTAEGERAILEQVFVYVDEFSQIMAPPVGNPRLLIGSKGSGKSAVLDFALRVLRPQNVPAVLLAPFDIDTTLVTEGSSTGDMVRLFYSVLMTAIVAKLADSSSGLLTGDNATLHQEAVASGTKSPDFIGRLVRFLSETAKPLVKVDFMAAFPHLTRVTQAELEKAVGRALDRKSFYLFIDDTDQIANPDRTGHLNRIWALLLAVRRLAANVPELRAVVSVRTEVWERLKVDQSGQRDQTDHFNSLCVFLRCDRAHVVNIVERRLTLASKNLSNDYNIYSSFFQGQDARAPFSEDRRSWRDLIVVRSRERPRDAIQLINELAQRAGSEKKSLIDEDVFRSVMPIVSERIAREFAQEVSLECPQAIDVLRTFANIDFDSGSFTMSPEQAFEHFRKIPSRFNVQLHGVSVQQNLERDVFDLWRFFYICGVVNARVSDITSKDGYRHLAPENDPMLVTKARWNDVQKNLWEINTVFRDFLIAIGKADSRRSGLARKQIPRNTRAGRRPSRNKIR